MRSLWVLPAEIETLIWLGLANTAMRLTRASPEKHSFLSYEAAMTRRKTTLFDVLSGLLFLVLFLLMLAGAQLLKRPQPKKAPPEPHSSILERSN